MAPSISELDHLINELTAKTTLNQPTGFSDPLESGREQTKTVTHSSNPSASELVDDPRTLKEEELLKRMGFQPFLVRLASAEILKLNEQDQNLHLKEDVQHLLEAVVANKFSDRLKLHIANHRKILEEIVRRSGAVHRYQIMNGDAQTEAPPAPQNFVDIFYHSVPQPLPPQKKGKGFFAWFFGSKTKQDSSTAMEIPYENPEQFAHALKDRPPDKRVEIIEKQAPKMGLLSHLEIYRILMAIPSEMQDQVYRHLKQNLIGRIDFYPLEVLKLAADIEGVSSLDITPVNKRILLADLRETGMNLDVFEVYAFLKLLDLPSSEIWNALSGRKVSLEQLKEFFQRRNSILPFDEALNFTGLFIENNTRAEIIEMGRQFLKTVYVDEPFLSQIDTFFDSKLASKKRAAESPTRAHDEAVQISLIKEFETHNWSFDRYEDHLFQSLKVLDSIRPVSGNVNVLRIKAVAKAMFGTKNEHLRNAAADVLLNIAGDNQDALSQATLCEEIKPNWNYSKDVWLLKIVEIYKQLKPANAEDKEKIITELGKAQRSENKHVRDAASKAICSLASCTSSGVRNEVDIENQLKDIAKIDWEDSKRQDSHILSAIHLLRELHPMNDTQQGQRINLLNRALVDGWSLEASAAAAEAINHIARTNRDFFTQTAILTQAIRWSDQHRCHLLLQLISAVSEIKPANEQINVLRREFLQQATSSDSELVRNKAKLVQCMVSQCEKKGN